MASNNKLWKGIGYGLILLVVGSALSWFIWQTNATFAAEKRISLIENDIKQINCNIEAIKDDMKQIKDKSQEDRVDIKLRQQQIMDMLIDMKKKK